jgi:hypothetical protein
MSTVGGEVGSIFVGVGGEALGMEYSRRHGWARSERVDRVGTWRSSRISVIPELVDARSTVDPGSRRVHWFEDRSDPTRTDAPTSFIVRGGTGRAKERINGDGRQSGATIGRIKLLAFYPISRVRGSDRDSRAAISTTTSSMYVSIYRAIDTTSDGSTCPPPSHPPDSSRLQHRHLTLPLHQSNRRHINTRLDRLT